jgi:thiol-disulfide isomerase/thioredoxin
MPNFFKISGALFVLIYFVFISANAGITQGQIEVIFNIKEIGAIPKKGFHINDKAPASIVFDDAKVKSQPSVKSEQKILFVVPAEAQKAQLKFYVCDDAKTVCEQQTHDVDLKAKRKESKKVSSADSTAKFIKVSSAAVQVEVTDESSGYLAASVAPVRTLAQSTTDKPTLLVFSAPWCPACIRLKSETLNQPGIKKLLKKVHVNYLNIDLVEHEAVSNKYNVKAIPTMILLSKNGNEINRWLDFQLAGPFRAEFTTSLKLSDLEQTKKMADLGDQKSIRRMAENAFSQMDWLEAAKWYSLSKNKDDLQKKLYSEISKARDDKDDDKTKTDEYLRTLLKATTLSQSKLDTQMWTIEYFEQIAEQSENPLTDENKSLIMKSITQLNALVNDPKQLQKELKHSTMTGLYGFESMEALDIVARGYELLKDNESKKQTQERMFKMAAAEKVNFDQPGAVIHIIYYMSQSKHILEAEELTKKLIERYPKTYVYYDRYAKMLLKQNRLDEALEQVNRALVFKEGNEPQLNLVKTKILVGLKKTEEAVTLVDQTLKIIEPYPNKYKRTKASLASIKSDLTKPK